MEWNQMMLSRISQMPEGTIVCVRALLWAIDEVWYSISLWMSRLELFSTTNSANSRGLIFHTERTEWHRRRLNWLITIGWWVRYLTMGYRRIRAVDRSEIEVHPHMQPIGSRFLHSERELPPIPQVQPMDPEKERLLIDNSSGWSTSEDAFLMREGWSSLPNTLIYRPVNRISGENILTIPSGHKLSASEMIPFLLIFPNSSIWEIEQTAPSFLSSISINSLNINILQYPSFIYRTFWMNWSHWFQFQSR